MLKHPLMAILHPFLLLLLSGFSIAVASSWFRYHILTGDNWLWVAFPLITYGVFASGAVFLLWRSKTQLYLSPIRLLVLLLLTLFLIFESQTFLRPLFLTGTPLLPGQGILAADLSFGKTIASILALFITLTLLFASTGSLTLRLARLSGQISGAGPALRFALQFIAGIGTWIALLILCHWIGLLSARPLVFISAIILFAERRRLLEIGRWCVKKTECPALANPFNALVGVLLLFIIAFNLVETIRPIPTGYDDMTHYMNRVTLMTERQSLLDQSGRYAFELLAAGISIVADKSGQQLFALSFGTYGLLIGTLFIFLFGREFFGFRSGLVAAAIFLSTPMGPALAILETKPDSLLLPLTVALIWFLLEAERSKNLAFFYFACFSFGLAISTKLTGAIFLPGLVIGFLLIVWSRQPHWPSVIRGALLGIFFFALAFLPWFLTDELREVQAYLRPDTTTTLAQDLGKELWISGQKCSFLGQNEDMLRFDPEPGWDLKEIFTAPWHLTMNRYASLFATEFGFLYLALIPLGLFILFRALRTGLTQTSRPIVLMVVTVAGAIALWGVYAEHIAWYFYPALPLLSLLIAVIFEQHQRYRSLRWLLIVLIVLGLLGNTLVRMKFGSSEPRLRYAAGAITADEYAESVFPGYPISMQILNLYPEARILVTGSRHWYGIRDNDRRAYLDAHLDTFSCLLNHHGPDGMIAVLRKLGIRYIFFSKSLMSEYEGTSRPTFTKKIREFVEFSRTHLRVDWGSPSHMIYRVPQASERAKK